MASPRGTVIALTPEQRVQRALYLASPECPTIYYRLEYPNGGTDPKAKDPAVRWSRPGSTFVNVTCDCMGGAAWIGGFDRFQPTRFKHIYGGYINCDSMRFDAAGPAKCFERLDKPEPGCMVVFGSVDYDGDGQRDRVGHVGTVVSVPADWNPKKADSWKAMRVVDVSASRKGRANAATSGLGWYGVDRRGVAKDSWFLRSKMRAG